MVDETETESEQEPKKKANIVSFTIDDKQKLYKAYMPYIKNGGLFITTNTAYEFGDDVVVLLKLLDEPDKLAIQGRIVWVNPKGTEGGRPTGIGVQFTSDNAEEVCKKIDTYLSGMPRSEGTFTI